jgi:AmmeMemoRadiSam system protein A
MLNDTEKGQLKDLAWCSIRHGLETGSLLPVEPDHFQPNLFQVRASFVSLHRHDHLRGCIGTLEAFRPLTKDVIANAYAAAFQDPRFEPLRERELDGLELKVSVLTPQVPMDVCSEQELLNQLQPGKDGIVLELGVRRATFLPAVWEQLPNPHDFLYELKRKAGLDPASWDPKTQVYRYTTDEF